MRRTAAALVCAATMVLLTSGSAGAAPPIHTRLGVEEFDVSIEGVCEFDVTVHVRQRLNVTFFLDGDGDVVRGKVTGPIVAVATNLDTGASIRQVIPGPAFLDADGALVRATGPWAFLFTVEGDVINAWGHITFDEEGVVVGVRGRTESFCEALSEA